MYMGACVCVVRAFVCIYRVCVCVCVCVVYVCYVCVCLSVCLVVLICQADSKPPQHTPVSRLEARV